MYSKVTCYILAKKVLLRYYFNDNKKFLLASVEDCSLLPSLNYNAARRTPDCLDIQVQIQVEIGGVIPYFNVTE